MKPAAAQHWKKFYFLRLWFLGTITALEWVKKAEVDSGKREDVTSIVREQLNT